MPRRSLDTQHSIVEAAHEYGIILDSREVFIYGGVDEEGELGDKFLKNMRMLEQRHSDKPIIIHQFSVGGDWSCGMSLFDTIVTCPCPILFVCHGLAASMGSVIPMACAKHENSYRVNMPNCDWMIHDGTTDIVSGHTIKQSKSWAAWESRTGIQMMDFYVAACCNGEKYVGKTHGQIRTLIKKKLDSKEDWWLSAREAVEHGFVNAVLGDEGFESIPFIIKNWNG